MIHRARAAFLLICLGGGPCYGESQLTPSGGAGNVAPGTDVLRVPGSRPIPFATASQQLTAVFPVRISRFEQAVQNSYNWHGEADASLSCQLGFTPEAVVVSGTLLDDQPLVQLHTRPARPDWWRITYGADGVVFHIQDVTSSTQLLHFALNFGSAGVQPKIELFQAPTPVGTGFLETATLELAELEPVPQAGGAAAQPPTGFRFRAILPTAGLLEPSFLAGPLQISVKLHDLDGAFSTYSCLEERVEKAP